MIPRLSTSKKWTSLPPELCGQIREVFEESFSEAAKAGKMLVEGRIYPDELLLRVGYLENGRLAQANFEVSLDFNSAKQNALEQIHFVIDCAASLMQEYFDREQDLEDFPRQWQPMKIDNRNVFIQITTENSSLEAEANRLLGVADDSLVQNEEEETETEQAVISMLGLDKEDFEEAEAADENPESKKSGASVKKSGAQSKNQSETAKKPKRNLH